MKQYRHKSTNDIYINFPADKYYFPKAYLNVDIPLDLSFRIPVDFVEKGNDWVEIKPLPIGTFVTRYNHCYLLKISEEKWRPVYKNRKYCSGAEYGLYDQNSEQVESLIGIHWEIIEPLLITEDGVKKYEGDRIWRLNTKNWEYKEWTSGLQKEWIIKTNPDYKFFDTETSIEIYIHENKPMYSANDVIFVATFIKKTPVYPVDNIDYTDVNRILLNKKP